MHCQAFSGVTLTATGHSAYGDIRQYIEHIRPCRESRLARMDPFEKWFAILSQQIWIDGDVVGNRAHEIETRSE